VRDWFVARSGQDREAIYSRQREGAQTGGTINQPITQAVKSPGWHFITDTLRYLPASVLPALFTLTATAIYSRIFPPSEYGVYSLVLAITGPLITLLSEWAAQPIGRFYAEYAHRNEMDEYRQIVATVALLIAAAVGALIAVAAAGSALMGGAFRRPLVFVGAAAVVLTQSLTSSVLPILPASLQSTPYRRAIVASTGLSLGMALALIYLFKVNIAWLLWGQAIAAAITLPYVYRSANIHPLEFARRWTPQVRSTLVRFWRYGGPMMLWMFAAALLNIGDRYVIQFFEGSTAVGIYSVNYNLITMAIALINAPVLTAAFPILMHQWARKQSDTARKTLAQMTQIYLFLGIGLVGGTAVISRPLVDVLLGPEMRAGYVIHLPVAAGAVLWGASKLGQKSMEFAERTRLMLWNVMIAAAINVALNLVLVPTFGYVAAAYTTLASYAVYVALVWWQARRLVPWDIPYRQVALNVGAAIVSWAVGVSATRVTDIAILKLVIGGISFVCTYGAINLIFLWWGAGLSLRGVFK
jgi:O-antigen/teichoic acid export membrane protein